VTSPNRWPRSSEQELEGAGLDRPGLTSWDDVPAPRLVDDTDVIVRVDVATICESDHHIAKGDLPEVTPGRIFGHQAVGTVEQVRVPFADDSIYPAPAGVPVEEHVMLADILPTGYEVGV
jgi:threonine dehydrogenase-like Zn-dependent dehydrogenase